MTDCLFCKIINGHIPADKVFENDRVLVFRDIMPQAPTHLLIIPKIHIATINDTQETHQALLGELILTANQMAEQAGLSDNGYRLIFNVNQDGGQAVYHIHLHLMGGRAMAWPPG
jgi:histidine triad (HIT) family protein